MNNFDVANSSSSPDHKISLKELIHTFREWQRYLVSKIGIIFAFVMIGSVAGLCYAVYDEPLYKAELTFALEDASNGVGLGGALGLATQFGLNVGGEGGGAFSGDNLLYLMTSRSLFEKAFLAPIQIDGQSTTLAEHYIEINNFRDSWESDADLNHIHFKPNAESSGFSQSQDSILNLFHGQLVGKSLTVERIDKKLSVIRVVVESPSEIFSKLFAETLVSEVAGFYIETKTKKASENLSILQHQTDSVRSELNSAISGVAMSADVNPNPNIGRQILKAPSQRRAVDVQANQAILIELVKNLEMAKISLRKETPLIQIIDRPILPLKMEKWSKKLGLLAGGAVGCLLGLIVVSGKKILNDLDI